VRVLIRARAIITMRGPGLGIIEYGGVYIEDGLITCVGRYGEVIKHASKDDYYLNLSRSGVVMPAFYDMHMHTELNLLKGFANDMPESQWMELGVSPLASMMEWRHVKASTMLAITEALKTGTVVYGEYSRHLERQIDEIYKPIGLKVFGTFLFNALVEPMHEVSGKLYPLDAELGFKALDETDRLIKKYRGDDKIRILYGPQAMDMVPLEVVRDAFVRAGENSTYVHMHVAQGARERRQMMRRYGLSTVDLMLREGLLNNMLFAAHLHDTTENELRRVAERMVKMVACYRSISSIDGVVPPLTKFMGYGGRAVVGTDNAVGPGNQSILKELGYIALLSKVYEGDPTEMPPWTLLRIPTVESSRVTRAFGNGVIEEGYKGDIMVLDLWRPNTLPILSKPIRNYPANIVYSILGSEVTHVFIDGVPYVEDGVVKVFNEMEVLEEAQKAAEDLIEKGGEQYIDTWNYLVERCRSGLF